MKEYILTFDEDKCFIAKEPTSLFKGVVQEDMTETVKRTKLPYIKVLIEEFWSKDEAYPLTYVENWQETFDIKKDDVVWVEFHHGEPLYPIYFCKDGELESFYTEDEMPSNTGNVTFPSAETPQSVRTMGDDGVITATEKYIHIKKGGLDVILKDEDGVYLNVKTTNIYSGNIKIEDSNGNKIDTNNAGILIQDSNSNKISLSSSGFSVQDRMNNKIESSGVMVKINNSLEIMQ